MRPSWWKPNWTRIRNIPATERHPAFIGIKTSWSMTFFCFFVHRSLSSVSFKENLSNLPPLSWNQKVEFAGFPEKYVASWSKKNVRKTPLQHMIITHITHYTTYYMILKFVKTYHQCDGKTLFAVSFVDPPAEPAGWNTSPQGIGWVFYWSVQVFHGYFPYSFGTTGS